MWWTRVGPPGVLVLGEAPDPRPAAGQVQIRVALAGIHFIETLTRAGRLPRPGPRPPAILGNAVGGTIVAVGEGVGRDQVGRRVVSSTGGSGGYAELAVAAVADAIGVPEGMSLVDAVALFADGRTALGLHRRAAPKPGETVLISSAGGGLGILLSQLATAAGARVIATAGSARKLELARGLGAAAAIDYTAPDWAQRLAGAAPDGLDLAYDGVGGTIGRTIFDALAPGGRFVVHGMASGTPTDTSEPRAPVTVIGIGELASIAPPMKPVGIGLSQRFQSARELATAVLAEAAAGRLRPVIGQTYPLERAAAAHAAIEARQTIGKTLLTVAGSPFVDGSVGVHALDVEP
jgi:NADPH2:quinone reductase